MSLTLTNEQLAKAFGYPRSPEGAIHRIQKNRNLFMLPANRLRKALRIGTGALADLEASRMALLDTCAKKDEAGQMVTVEGSSEIVLAEPDRFQAGYAELMAATVTLEGVEPVTFKQLENIQIAPEDLDALDPFITE
jgi:hypothetical protein